MIKKKFISKKLENDLNLNYNVLSNLNFTFINYILINLLFINIYQFIIINIM